jgi:beta-glucuronidase
MYLRVLLLCAVAGAAIAAPATDAGAASVYVPPARALYHDGPSGRYLLGGDWLFRDDAADTGARDGLPSSRSTTGWRPVAVPNAFNAGTTSRADMAGHPVWYRKDFKLPSARTALSWVVRFESVNYTARVWLNGKRLGTHQGAFLAFELPLSRLSRRGVNRLVVQVDNRHKIDDLPPGGAYTEAGGAVGGWWNYGGLLREVYLRRVDRVDISPVVVRPRLRCRSCAAAIEETATLRNYSSRTQRVSVSGRYGSARVRFPLAVLQPGAVRTLSASVRISHPRLWSPSHPNLYAASFLVRAGPAGEQQRTVASYALRSGVRSIVVSKTTGRLLLNFKPVNFRGVAVHEDDPVLGAALGSAERQKLIANARGVGATLLRSHYPLHPEFQETADRLGMLIWSEIPVYQLKAKDLESAHARRLEDQFLRQNISINQNHPSVAVWSVANELRFEGGASEARYYRHAATLAHGLDPTRPVAAAIGTYPGIGCVSAYAPLDLIGINEYFGWYSGGEGGIADRDALGPHLDSLRACYPHKALVVSEFGFEANRTGAADEKGTYEFQSDAVAYHLGVFAGKPWLSGAIYWALQDFRCQPGWGGGNPRPDPPFHRKGLVSYLGAPKPAYSVARKIFRSTQQYGP